MNLPLQRTLSYSEIVNLEDYTRDDQMPNTTELKTYLEASLSEIKAKQGGVLLSGFGGDECVTYNQYPHFIAAAARGEKWKSLLNSLSCLLYTSPSPRDLSTSRMPSSA